MGVRVDGTKELCASVPAVGDGALDFWQAPTEVFPEARHQRYLVHKIANVANALPKFAKTYTAKSPKAVPCPERV